MVLLGTTSPTGTSLLFDVYGRFSEQSSLLGLIGGLPEALVYGSLAFFTFRREREALVTAMGLLVLDAIYWCACGGEHVTPFGDEALATLKGAGDEG